MTLHIIATPIGNLEDITLRALRVLGEIDALACEDTRITRRLLERHGIDLPQMFSYHEHNEIKAAPRILNLLRDGKRVGLCSDGGMPGISDPGYRIVNDALEAELPVEVLPGACAVETALLAGGMPTASYTFLGFPPPKSGKRRNFFSANAELPHTLVLYESPRRLGACLQDALAVLGDRRAAVCIELTKKFERTFRGWLKDLAADFARESAKGEVTLVFAGKNRKFLREGK